MQDELREALKPFTDKARDVDERVVREAKDTDLVWVRVTWGDFQRLKRAAEALSRK